jgi:hypothetical protein
VKQRNATTVPFTYLGPAYREHHESERPIKVVWRLRHPMPAEMFEMNRRGGVSDSLVVLCVLKIHTQELREPRIPVRVITTLHMGTSNQAC